MKTTLTQRIAAAEALIANLRADNKHAREANGILIKKCKENIGRVCELTDDLQDAKEENDRLQGRLALQTDTLEFYRDSLMIVEDRLEEIRSLPHPWWTVFVHPKSCPICAALPL